jgi:hypothetical protein
MTAKRFLVGLIVLVLCLLISGSLQAQSSTANLTGKVTGPSGTAVPNATVAVKNVATGQLAETQTNTSGVYNVPNLTPGDYEISVSLSGQGMKSTKTTLTSGATQTVDLVLPGPSGNAVQPSLGELGFPPAETQGSAQEQARLNKRSHMLMIHQRLGLITVAPLLAAIFAANGAAGRHGTASGRELHTALGAAAAGMYFSTAYFAIFAPKIHGTTTRGPIRLHKALAWIHGPGMILTPFLGALAYDQRNRGEKVHGIAKAHSAVAIVTAGAYGLAILSVSIKF